MTGAPPGRGPLVGRDEELAVLREALVESADGCGRFVLVSGEAGIGKSRLLEEVATTASATHVVLTGRAVEGGGAYRPVADALVGALRAGLDVTPASLGPYGPALARLLPDWSSVAGASSAEPGVDPGLVLGEAVARFLGVVGRGRPCLLLLEDLHWADADSWAVLAHVAVVVPSLPVVVVATLREDEPGTTPATALSRLPGVTTLRLARLSRADVHRLAVALGAPDPATWTMLDDRADGLPFLVEELVALRGSGAVPPTLRALVADRLALLTPEHRRVLAGAAVLGLAPDWTLLHRVTDISEPDVLAALRAAEESRLLTVEAGTLRWRHALTHEAVLAPRAATGTSDAVPASGRGPPRPRPSGRRRGGSRAPAEGGCRRHGCRPAAHPGAALPGRRSVPDCRAAARRARRRPSPTVPPRPPSGPGCSVSRAGRAKPWLSRRRCSTGRPVSSTSSWRSLSPEPPS